MTIQTLKDALETAFDYMSDAHATAVDLYKNHPLERYKEVIDDYEQVKSVIEAMPTMGVWLPLDTVPEHGMFLVYMKTNEGRLRNIEIAFTIKGKSGIHWRQYYPQTFRDYGYQLLGWQPLPDLPKE